MSQKFSGYDYCFFLLTKILIAAADRLFFLGGLGITLAEFFNVSEMQETFSDVTAKFTPKQKQLLMEFLKSI